MSKELIPKSASPDVKLIPYRNRFVQYFLSLIQSLVHKVNWYLQYQNLVNQRVDLYVKNADVQIIQSVRFELVQAFYQKCLMYKM